MSLKIGDKIAELRKQQNMTQEELANILGVTNQAISKWESNKCCPDIELVPEIADVFKCSIDMLFCRDSGKTFQEGGGNTYELCTEFPWADDEIIRGVVCKGRKILNIKSGIIDKFTFEYIGQAKSVKSHCSLYVAGDVSGGCTAGHSISIEGNSNGAVAGGHSVAIGRDVNGSVSAGHSLSCEGNISGDVQCKRISVGGDVTAESISGNVNCNDLKCSHIDGKIETN